jgi:hypothetical protein
VNSANNFPNVVLVSDFVASSTASCITPIILAQEIRLAEPARYQSGFASRLSALLLQCPGAGFPNLLPLTYFRPVFSARGVFGFVHFLQKAQVLSDASAPTAP